MTHKQLGEAPRGIQVQSRSKAPPHYNYGKDGEKEKKNKRLVSDVRKSRDHFCQANIIRGKQTPILAFEHIQGYYWGKFGGKKDYGSDWGCLLVCCSLGFLPRDEGISLGNL